MCSQIDPKSKQFALITKVNIQDIWHARLALCVGQLVVLYLVYICDTNLVVHRIWQVRFPRAEPGRQAGRHHRARSEAMPVQGRFDRFG